MPLIHGSSKAAVSENIRRERDAGKKPSQAVAIALDVARRAKRATGGSVHVGSIHSAVGGRTDHLAMSVPSGSYVVPADIVSGLGQGNTQAGLTILERMFPPDKEGAHKEVPIMAAGGEFVISPKQVRIVGGGDENRGHKILDEWILRTRKKLVKTLNKLPGPAR